MKDIGEPVMTTNVVCFARGTRLAGPAGERPVEHLAVGDDLLTASGGQRRIVWIRRRHIDCACHPKPGSVWPVRIAAGAFGPGMPVRDLLLSPQHAVFAEGVLIPVKCLINASTVRQEARASIDYLHVELGQHDILLAGGLPTESYLDTSDRACFENGGAALVLYPDFARLAWDGRGCAELKVIGPEVAAVRANLAERARAAFVPDQVDAASAESS
jgi:Hint domain-containing protein